MGALQNPVNEAESHKLGPAAEPSLVMTRRVWFKQVGDWTSRWALAKQVATAVGGMTSGGAVVYGYLAPKLKSVVETDFFVGNDTTDVSLDASGNYVKVRISRKFDQEATKTGYYKYRRLCDGTWSKADCMMVLRKAGGSTERLELTVESETEDGDVLSVIEPRDAKPIFVSRGDVLEVNLVSEENIEKIKGGYRLRLNAQFAQSSFTLHISPGFSPQNVECFVYAEKQGQALQPVSLGKVLTFNHCTRGLEYLIAWTGRAV
jgi:hypothetical protein